MALELDPKFHIDRVEAISKREFALRDRQERDFSLFRGDKFKMPKAEGKWDEVTANRATAEGNKIIDYLSYARRKLWIPISDEKESQRTSLSATERLAIGILALADDINQNDPFGILLQNLASWYAVVRGWREWFVYLQDEGGKLIPHIQTWDKYQNFFISGNRKILWDCNVRYVTKEEILDEYKGWNGTIDDKNMAPVYFVCDPDEMGTIIGSEWVKPPEKHNLDYIPIRIKPCRSTPLVQSERFPNTIADVGESYLANTRNLHPTLSRLLTYNMTRAGRLAKQPIFIGYDSSLGSLPPEFDENSPQAKGAVVTLDKGKGQEVLNVNTVPTGVSIAETFVNVEQMISMGGLARVAWGTLDAALPAQGIDILAHATMDVIKPFKQALEEDFVWVAEEIVRQYKAGNFGEMQVEGFDNANNKFRLSVKPKDIDTNWRFSCELMPSLLRDEQMNMNMATQAVKTGLLSYEDARDKYNLVDDTDLAQQKINREKMSQVFEVSTWEGIADLAKDKGWDYPPVRFMLFQMMQRMSAAMMGQNGQQPMEEAVGGGIPGANIRIPGMTPESTTPSVPGEIQQKARLARRGLKK